MVISIAMLGIGSAGTILAVYSGRLERNFILTESIIPFYSAATGIAILISYIASNYIPFDPVRFSWEKSQFFYLALYCLILSIPFFFSGLLIATVFLLYSESSMPIYSSDLVGAGAGSGIVLMLLDVAPPEYAVLSASTLCLLGGIAHRKRTAAIISVFFLLINAVMLFAHPPFIDVEMSQYKKLSVYLKYPGAEHLNSYYSSYSRIDTFKSPAIRFAPGLSLKFREQLPQQVGLAIDGDRIDVITNAQNEEALKFLEYLPSSIVYELGNSNNVLVIDPRGGLHALMARHYNSGIIHKVESNPFVLRLIRNNFNEFSGGIYNENTRSGYGRNFLHRLSLQSGHTLRYDVIDIPMMSSTVSGTFGISEDYGFTVEAFETYLNGLEKDGIISISLYLIPPPRTEIRLLATLIKALENTGIKDIPSKIVAIRSWDSMTILAKKTAFTIPEIEIVKTFSDQRNFDIVYYPGISEDETSRYIKTPSNDLYHGFMSLLNPAERGTFIDNYLFDIRPVHDSNPFFHYFLKFENIKAIYKVMDRKLLFFINEGYLLPFLLIIVLALSFLIILIPVITNAILIKSADNREKNSMRPRILPTLIYFGMLGIGFMSIEVSLIQKGILILENPSYSVAVVIASLLISSGTGSMSGSKFPWLSSPYSLIILVVIIFASSIIQPFLSGLLTALGLYWRIPALLMTIIPLGFFMGLPFPMGMRIIGEKNETLIPWAWAINACLSVLAPILTIMIALSFGFDVVLWMAGLMYVIAFFALKKLIISPRS